MQRALPKWWARTGDAGARQNRANLMQLGVQLAWAGALTILCLLVHGAGTVGITRLLRLEERKLRTTKLGPRSFALLSGLAFCVFVLHAIEIGVFAAFYLAAGVLPRLDQALYFSASAYSTLGTVDIALPVEWRLVGAIEGVAGFLLLGWSTAFFVTDMNALLREHPKP